VSLVTISIDLSGQVVLITGGTKGIGRGIGHRFAAAGATVVVCARGPGDEPLPEGWHFVAADIRDPEQASAMVDAAFALDGRLDAVVNNAGGAPLVDSSTVNARFSERIISLNLLAPLYVSQRANHYMQQQETGGSIVHIGSVTALRPAPQAAAYGAAKAGLLNLSATQGLEWAPKVRSNYIVSGMVRTEKAGLYYGDEEGIARVEATVPMGRLADPAEIGNVAVWLCSPMASYVTGAVVHAHGGGEKTPFLDAAKGD
jgi:NAD(P)-dependent dehydrogenase (short-subunit alcohol dehydrogenase family)